jgi:hypothetical protein
MYVSRMQTRMEARLVSSKREERKRGREEQLLPQIAVQFLNLNQNSLGKRGYDVVVQIHL